MTQFIPDRLTTIKQTPPPSGCIFSPAFRWWLTAGWCGRVEVHAVRHAGSILRLGYNFYLHREVFFFFPPPSLPCNYAAEECLSSTSGWSRHFLPHVHRPGRRTLPPLALLPQQTSPSENLPENNILDYIITFAFNSHPPAVCPKNARTKCRCLSPKKHVMGEHFLFSFFCRVNQTWCSCEKALFSLTGGFTTQPDHFGWLNVKSEVLAHPFCQDHQSDLGLQWYWSTSQLEQKEKRFWGSVNQSVYQVWVCAWVQLHKTNRNRIVVQILYFSLPVTFFTAEPKTSKDGLMNYRLKHKDWHE